MKKITAIITVDDRMGIAFNKRRQSRDRMIIEDVAKSSDGVIYISSYSEQLFEEYKDKVAVVTEPLKECPDGGCCFLEMTNLNPFLNDISTLVVYRWNRLYPSDKKLDIDPQACGFEIASTDEFAGYSHDRITKEIYVKLTK